MRQYEKKFTKIKDLTDNDNKKTMYKKLRKLYKSNPFDNRVKFEMAKLLYAMGDDKLDIALRYFEEIYNVNHYSPSKLYMGRILVIKGQYEEAHKCFIELVGTQCMVDAFIELGKLAENINGDEKLANKYYAEARRILKARDEEKTYRKIYK